MRARKVLALLATAALLLPVAPASAASNEVHVRAGATGGTGSEDSPFGTIKEGLAAVEEGGTVVVHGGIYREGYLEATTKDITLQEAEGETAVLSGADVATNWTSSGSTWVSTGHFRFCRTCVVNPNPSAEGMAAYPEQVFVDGVEQVQVASEDAVTEGTFYVRDSAPVTGTSATGWTASSSSEGVTYVLGTDPTGKAVEITERARALTVHGNATGFTMSGITVTSYAPVQAWGYEDPTYGSFVSAAAVFVARSGANISDNEFTRVSGGAALDLTTSSGSTVASNRFASNGAVALGLNRSDDVTVRGNYFRESNTSGWLTRTCGSYCTVGDVKVTHAERVTFDGNTWDYSGLADRADPQRWHTDGTVALWFDEGVIDSWAIRNRFVNTAVAYMDEVSARNVFASNAIQGGTLGVIVSGSEDARIWNNAITGSQISVTIQEDSRTNGCNARDPQTKVCTAPEEWSVSKGLSWNVSGTEIVNNVLSSESALVRTDDVWINSMLLRVTGGVNDDGTQSWADQMIAYQDWNLYYRATNESKPSSDIVWQTGQGTSINADTVKAFNTSVPRAEANGLDARGNRNENPFFQNESSGDLRLSIRAEAMATGATLPDDIAAKLGLPSGAAVRGPVSAADGSAGGQWAVLVASVAAAVTVGARRGMAKRT